MTEWWEVLPYQQRAELAYAFRQVAALPDIWEEVAAEIRDKSPDIDYAKGQVSGLGVAASQARRALAALDAATPHCPHGKGLLTVCLECD